MPQNVIFRQLADLQLTSPVSTSYTYIIGCPRTHEAVIVDPVLEAVERDIKVHKACLFTF